MARETRAMAEKHSVKSDVSFFLMTSRNTTPLRRGVCLTPPHRSTFMIHIVRDDK